MKFLMNKYGYISIEIVIVIAVIFLGGIIGISKYSAKGKETTSKTNDTVAKVYKDYGNVDLSSNTTTSKPSNSSTNDKINMLIAGQKFNSLFVGKNIKEVKFIKSSNFVCDSSEEYELSVNNDGNIKGCINDKKLTVYSKDEIFANYNSHGVFNGYKTNAFPYTTKLDLKNFNTSYIKDFGMGFGYFGYLIKDEDIVISGLKDFDLKNTEELYGLFDGTCASTRKFCDVDGLNNWDVSNVKNFNHIFSEFNQYGPNNNVNIESWKPNSTANTTNMFALASKANKPSWYK